MTRKKNKKQSATTNRTATSWGKKNETTRSLSTAATNVPPHSQQQQQHQKRSKTISPSSIKGMDDEGTFYNSHDELLTAQTKFRTEFYHANTTFWENGGCNGATDDEAMTGDTGGIEDGEEGLAFLDKLAAMNGSSAKNSATTTSGNKADLSPSQSPSSPVPKISMKNFDHAVDLGAGVGRVTKLVLLKRYNNVRLVEADTGWSKRSKTYLGRKRAARCSFVNQRLDDLSLKDVQDWSEGNAGQKADLMWIQWTFQYMIDVDVVSSLKVLATGLKSNTGVLVVKENRPYGTAREDRFQMDMPQGEGEHERYDITRSDDHHRLLFQNAGLRVAFVEKGVETHTYALMV